MLKRTPLYDLHRSLGAKMVPFAGFEMPIQYTSIVEEHRWVRQHAGLFDVSHMGELRIEGDRAMDFVSYVTSNDPTKLEIGQVQYSALLNENGGFVDDLLVYRLADDAFLLVVNAANVQKDFEWIQSHAFAAGVTIRNLSDEIGELALQGPKAEEVLQPWVPFDLRQLPYYWSTETSVAGLPVLLSRTGYTGEDGFEIYGDPAAIAKIASVLLDHPWVKPVGLGARDTLRLEMGYPLYGNDIDETTNPFEAGLRWIVKMQKSDFIGKSALLEFQRKGVARKRIGFLTPERRTIPRKGMSLTHQGKDVGTVTSGSYSPMLDTGIGMAYVEIWALGEETLTLRFRGQAVPVQQTTLPFYKHGTVRRSAPRKAH